MKYRVREGLVLDHVCGEYLLIATRMARPYCPYITKMNKDSVFVWKMLEKEMPLKQMLQKTAETYQIPEEAASGILLPFIQDVLKKGYIVELEQ